MNMPKKTSVQDLLLLQNSRNSANEKFIAEAGVTQERMVVKDDKQNSKCKLYRKRC
jgi:hypothetical protein